MIKLFAKLSQKRLIKIKQNEELHILKFCNFGYGSLTTLPEQLGWDLEIGPPGNFGHF